MNWPDLEDYVSHMIERSIKGAIFEQHGLVTSYDPETHSAKLTLQPEGQETGWVPIHVPHAGGGFGIVVGLNINDQVTVQSTNGDIDSAKITARVHSDEDKPPKVEAGEMLFQHESGHNIKFDKDKNIIITHGVSGGTITWDPSGNLVHDLKGKEHTVHNASSYSINP